ncbi:hypothetical protein GY50_0505 [Dehalococcoides mccartyi GY50]|nr:hypothetical protein GY50_0505 [Dehalococcoides mccartyi GY50]
MYYLQLFTGTPAIIALLYHISNIIWHIFIPFIFFIPSNNFNQFIKSNRLSLP